MNLRLKYVQMNNGKKVENEIIWCMIIDRKFESF